jgi:hypothetical protein
MEGDGGHLEPDADEQQRHADQQPALVEQRVPGEEVGDPGQ